MQLTMDWDDGFVAYLDGVEIARSANVPAVPHPHNAGVVPDRIMVFRNPTLRMCEDEDHVVEEVRITVVHEIAHHFGIDDDRLHDLGYA